MRGWVALTLAATAGACCPAPRPQAPVVTATPAPDAAPAPPRPASERCASGEAPACDQLAEEWGTRELLPAGLDAEARAAAAALAEACQARAISSACMGLALMTRYGTATGTPDAEAAKPLWARVRELGDLNGFRGEPASAEGAAALARTREDCQAGRARACTQLGWAAFSEVQQAKDVAAAYQEWRRGCDLGSALGCRWAGHVAYTYPEVGAAAEARALLERSCEAGNPGGCDELGQYLERVANDPAAALERYRAACVAGSKAACDRPGAR